MKIRISTLLTLGLALVAGCTTPEYTGSRTVVGEEIAWPEISDDSGLIKVRVFQSIKGAKVWTAKDSRVIAKYHNTYTNSYFFNTVVLKDTMTLELEIEPLLTTEPSATTGTTCSASGVLSPDGSQPNSP